MEVLVVFGIIIFIFIVFTKNTEEEKGIFHLKHIYGIPSCDYFTDISTSQPNLKNALIGGVIAGGAGAIIGAKTSKNKTEQYYFMEIVYTKNNKNAVIVLSDNPKNINNKLRELAFLLQSKAKINNIDIYITASTYEKSEMYKALQ